MPKLTTTVTVNLHGLRKFKDAVSQDMRKAPKLREAWHECVAIYARFLTARWAQFSRGGGNWKALKPSTLLRKIKKGLLPLILRATDTMFQAFAPEAARKPGKISEETPFGMRIGFGGGMQYPHSTGGATLAQIAMFHQKGMGHLPVRKIVVPPDTETRGKMRDVLQVACVQTAKGE